MLDVAHALTERLMVASKRSEAEGASFERLALHGFAAERARAVAT